MSFARRSGSLVITTLQHIGSPFPHNYPLCRTGAVTTQEFRISSQKRHQQRQRRTVVTHLSPTTSLLRSNTSDNEVYLIGTVHISQKSAEEVKELISVVEPQSIFLELDPARAARLRGSQGEDGEDALERSIRDVLSKVGGGGGILGSVSAETTMKTAFSGFYGLLRRYGYIPGVEMLAAMDEAESVRAALHYGDRDATDTLRELGGALLGSSPMSVMGALARTPPPKELESVLREALFGGGDAKHGMARGDAAMEALKTREHVALITRWMEEAMPEVADVLLHRRDRAMARNLRECCGRGKVVAVVGLAHVDGIEREWDDLGKGTSILPP